MLYLSGRYGRLAHKILRIPERLVDIDGQITISPLDVEACNELRVGLRISGLPTLLHLSFQMASPSRCEAQVTGELDKWWRHNSDTEGSEESIKGEKAASRDSRFISGT